ncbi:LysM peptidoglycan-binding domain-containing protein [Sinomonas albida]|uniref:LysM peptidoglycan-binding domain-containing protein n=1 Tax=Sinomonas albida TaxID=369942 RepID=UPI0010A7BA2F|nr:LysM domain-containing protein [Sinomonas albida]
MHSRSQALAGDSMAAFAILMLGLLMALAGRVLGDRASGESFDALLGLASSIAGLGIVTAWLVTMSLAMASALLAAAGRHGAASWAGAAAPAFMRRAAFAVLGVALAAGPAAHAASGDLDPAWQPSSGATAHATAVASTPTVTAATDSAEARTADSAAAGATDSIDAAALPTSSSELSWSTTALDPGWTPSKAVPLDGAPAGNPLVRAELRPTPPGRGAVEVRLGDTLWSIAARHLGAGASVSDIADAWPRWFDANRATIGTDPDLIRPGLLLVPPDG